MQKSRRLPRWSRQLAALVLAVVGPCAGWLVTDPAGPARPGLPGMAWADDSDDGDDAGSAGNASAGGGSASTGDGSGDRGAAVEPGTVAPQAVSAPFVSDELVALNPSPAALQRARQLLGASVISSIRHAALGVRVVRLRLNGVDAQTARDVMELRDPGVFELQHLYAVAQGAQGAQGAQPAGGPCPGANCGVRALTAWPAAAAGCGEGQTIGMVDTGVKLDHPVLQGAGLSLQAWPGERPVAQSDAHGTAVAALLVGQPDQGYAGLLPRARLLAANPFGVLPSGQVRADAAGLVTSLDWLAAEGASVVGMSLTGPPNRLLELAIARLQARGVVMVAAAGNGGRGAPPAYPAAYAGVLAVTAVSPSGRIYRRASQGSYVMYAKPGAEVQVVRLEGGTFSASGTSYAVPFLVSAVSQSLRERVVSVQQWRTGRGVPLQDLGEPGRDPVFGWGVPKVPVRCR